MDDKEPINLRYERARRSSNPEDWNPKDALLLALRDIENGLTAPTRIVIAMSEPCDDCKGVNTAWFIAGTDMQGAIGLLETAKHNMLAGE
jgi:hypothetical protein